MKLRFTNEWLRKRIEADPDDACVEAGGPPDICIDCDGEGRYPSGAVCKSCAGSGRVLPGDGIPTPAHEQ